MEKFPDTLFVIIGDGEERKALENEIAKLGLEKNIMLTGKIDDASKYLLALDIYISSSVKEGFPYSILEAMSAGVPIVCSNRASLPEVVSSAAYMVNPNNTADIAEGIVRITGNTDLRFLHTQKGLEQAKKFTWRQAAENWTLFR